MNWQGAETLINSRLNGMTTPESRRVYDGEVV